MFRHFRSLIFVAMMALVACARAESPFTLATTPGQLPKTVIPHNYQIELQPDLEHFTTHGKVTIAIEVLKPVREIILNALDLKVTAATLSNGRDIEFKPVHDARKQTVKLKLPSRLLPGHYNITLTFDGKIGEQAQGLFYVKYTTAHGKKIMLGTQMEPSDARRMFPCWDEPVFRAKFDLTVILPENFKGVSNLPIENETPLTNGLKRIKFTTTPPMATYLVLLVAGELETIEGEAEGVKLRVVTTEGKRE